MDDLPLVSVYLTTKDRLVLLKRAVKSVLDQTYPNIELIVADDGSTDGTKEYLYDLESKGILKAVINEGASKGACYGRNRAINLASGQFITGLDDDDYFAAHRIESFVKYWNEDVNYRSGVAGLYDSVSELRDNGEFILREKERTDYKSLRRTNSIGNQVFAPKDYFLGIGGFDINMPAWQDWDTWLRLSHSYGEFINIKRQSYVIDQRHSSERVSLKPEEKIRYAHKSLLKKCAPVSLSEKASLLDSLYSYSQVIPRIREVFLLLAFGRFRRVAQAFKRMLLK